MFHFIKAKSSDVELTYQIKCNSIKPYVERLWPWDDTHQQKLHKKKFNALNTSLIEFQEKIIGYIVISETNSEIYIENFMIDNTFQNLGIGKSVMERIIQKSCSKKKIIRLQVFKINIGAQRFYENLGFERISEKEFNFEMKRSF